MMTDLLIELKFMIRDSVQLAQLIGMITVPVAALVVPSAWLVAVRRRRRALMVGDAKPRPELDKKQ